MELLYFILGLCPILWLIFALTVLKMPTYKAALGSLIVAGVLAFIVWQLPAMPAEYIITDSFSMACVLMGKKRPRVLWPLPLTTGLAP